MGIEGRRSRPGEYGRDELPRAPYLIGDDRRQRAHAGLRRGVRGALGEWSRRGVRGDREEVTPRASDVRQGLAEHEERAGGVGVEDLAPPGGPRVLDRREPAEPPAWGRVVRDGPP